MSFQRTYLHTLAVAIDDAAAAVLFNRDDVTISALCGIERFARQGHAGAAGRLETLKLYRWQGWLLRGTGNVLEALFPGHLLRAILSDRLRGKAMAWMLDFPIP